ncbi:MAG: flagellar basal body P-ring protein FlgI [Planctomycetaceae bacterium]
MHCSVSVARLLLFTLLAVPFCDARAQQVTRPVSGPVVRIKDITQLAGEHPNQLVAYGLVSGLAGTGGSSESTKRIAIELLQRLGLRSEPQVRQLIRQAREKTDNLSVVIVSARLPPHAKKGQTIDVTVSAYDDAASLTGGYLIGAELTGVDGEVYVLASGPISLNGGNFGGQAAGVVKNHPTTGRIPDGGIVEREVPSTIFTDGCFHLLLRRPEYETARRITQAINSLSPSAAEMQDPAKIAVHIPYDDFDAPYEFVARCQALTVTPDVGAKVTINERTGTIVFTENVRLSSVAITHGNLIVSTMESPEVSQPAPLSQGETTVVPRTQVDVTEQGGAVNVLNEPATVADLAASLNALGVTPRDLSSIFQMLKESGALHAELIIQ